MSPRVGLDINIIINTAAELVDTEGLESITLAKIARKLNVRPPSLFNHIQGLPSIKRELSLLGLTQLYNSLQNALNKKEGDAAIYALAYAYTEFARKHPGLYGLILQAPDPSDKELQTASNQIIGLLSDVLKAYDLTEEDIIHAIRALRSILHGFSSLEQNGGFGLPVNLEKSFELMVDGFLASVKK
ncbi:TetR/AcrR family transcriptional regulator [Lysinibacillus antri]|uniref:TetR/AcrR family transcriptional regulator n=1 Tax=Lysinibacillus antri TaxID=2498145 RepID=A0A3S0R4D5_9BACI|nr:TetR-like C-terminal domain-containing protein [Lysinibacillus antri]RUL47886.1 TetR/AcrR family transcriptional regulator [Lysinibacillus antri]